MVSKVAERAQILKEQFLKMRLFWLPSSTGGAFLLFPTKARSIIQSKGTISFLTYYHFGTSRQSGHLICKNVRTPLHHSSNLYFLGV